MNTTSLFVELVVIGVGVLIWLLLLLVAFFGLPVMPPDNALLLATALPVLALIYVLGIVWDRLADVVFNRLWGRQLRDRYYDDIGAYYDDRRTILMNAPALAELLEYGRSRLRICRGWALNALLIGLTLMLVFMRQPDAAQPLSGLLLAASLASLLLALGAWLAWRNLTLSEYRKIREQARYLAAQGTEPA